MSYLTTSKCRGTRACPLENRTAERPGGQGYASLPGHGLGSQARPDAECRVKRPGDGAGMPVPDGLAVDPDHRDHLAKAGADEDLVGRGEVGRGERRETERVPEVRGELDEVGARDAGQDAGLLGGRRDLAPADDEDVGRGALDDVPGGVEDEGLVGALRLRLLEGEEAGEVV